MAGRNTLFAEETRTAAIRQEQPIDISTWRDEDFQAFIRKNAAVFNVFARKYAADPDAVNDILQESFIKLWSNREKTGMVHSPRSYVFSIIIHTIADNRRRAPEVGLDQAAQQLNNPDDDDAFLQNISETEASHLIARAVMSLSPQACKVILMTLEGENMKDIAARPDVSVNTVKTIRYRTLERLVELLSREDLLLLAAIGGIRFLWPWHIHANGYVNVSCA